MRTPRNKLCEWRATPLKSAQVLQAAECLEMSDRSTQACGFTPGLSTATNVSEQRHAGYEIRSGPIYRLCTRWPRYHRLDPATTSSADTRIGTHVREAPCYNVRSAVLKPETALRAERNLGRPLMPPFRRSFSAIAIFGRRVFKSSSGLRTLYAF